MAALCSMITLAVLLAIAFGIYSLISGLLVKLLPVDSYRRFNIWIVLLVFGFPTLVVGYFFYATRASAVYFTSFDEWPTPDVQIISSHQFVLGDSGDARIVFKASPTTIARIRSRLPVPTTVPATWPSTTSRFGFAWEEESLEYDSNTQVAMYSWKGID